MDLSQLVIMLWNIYPYSIKIMIVLELRRLMFRQEERVTT